MNAEWDPKCLDVVRAEAFDELVEFIEGFWDPRLRRLKTGCRSG